MEAGGNRARLNFRSSAEQWIALGLRHRPRHYGGRASISLTIVHRTPLPWAVPPFVLAVSSSFSARELIC